MKKTLTVLIIILLLSSVTAFAEDVLDEEHWAYRALLAFDTKGLFPSGIPLDGGLTRTEAAILVAELIQQLSSLSGEDVLLVDALENEFAYELSLLGESGESRQKQLDILLDILYRGESLSIAPRPSAAPGNIRVSGLSRLVYKRINVLGPAGIQGSLFRLAQSTAFRQEYRIDITGTLGTDILVDSYILGGGNVSFENRYGTKRSKIGVLSLEEFYLNILYRDVRTEVGKVMLPFDSEFVVGDESVTGISMSSASSRILIGQVTGDISPYIYAFGGLWNLSEMNKLELGAMYVDYKAEDEAALRNTGAVTSLDGKLSLSDILTLRGEYARSRDDTALRVGADVKLGAVTVEAGFHTVGPKFESPLGETEESDVAGYDFTTRVNINDLLSVYTKYDELQQKVSTDGGSDKVKSVSFGMTLKDTLVGELALEHEIKDTYPLSLSETTTSIDLKYFLTEAAVLRAGYKLLDRIQNNNLEGKGALAILGIDYNFIATNDTKVKAGYTFEKAFGLLAANVASVRLSTSAGVEYTIAKNAKLTADYSIVEKASESTSISTTVGLNYNINKDTVFSVGYRMLDFAGHLGSEEDYKANMALAELTIKF